MRFVVFVLSLLGTCAGAQSADDGRLSFDRSVDVTPFRARVTWSVYRGAHKERLDFAAFYRLVGREDLARQYTFWQRTRVSVGAVAVAVMVTGVVVGAWPFAVSCEAERKNGPAVFEQCRQSWARTTLPLHVVTGLGLLFFGSSLGGWAGGIEPHPVSFDAARALGENYNRKLDGVSVSPFVGPGGVGLSGTF